MSSRIKVLQAAIAALALTAVVGGGVGIASASGAAPTLRGTVQEQEATNAAEEVDGVDCENGIDAVTGAECDGGPAANPQDGADDAAEAAEAGGSGG